MHKKGLGRGLEALLGNGLDDVMAEVREVEMTSIRPNPWQPRSEFDLERLAELTQSVREHGVLQPVLLRADLAGRYELIAGERRFRAAQQAGLERIPAIVKEYADRQMLEVALIENLQREDIHPLDAARAYQRLQADFSMSQEQIAQRVGKSRSAVANTMRLLSLPAPIIAGLRDGDISEGHARALLQVAPALQLSAYRDIRQRGLNVREAEKLARERQPDSKRNKKVTEKPARDPEVAAVEEALQVALKTKVRVRSSGGAGRIEIEFYSQDELEGLLERIIGG